MYCFRFRFYCLAVLLLLVHFDSLLLLVCFFALRSLFCCVCVFGAIFFWLFVFFGESSENDMLKNHNIRILIGQTFMSVYFSW